MQHDRVNRVGLLKFKQQLLHGLNGVVTAQIDHYFLNLETYRKHRLIRPEYSTLRSLYLVLHNVSRRVSMVPKAKKKRNILIYAS